MAKIHPFRGVTYSKEKFGKDLSGLVTQPYDKIEPKMQDEYYTKNPNNFVRILLGKRYPSDDEYYNQYTRALAYMNCWLSESIFDIEEKPAIYVYHQAFEIEGKRIVRQGFVALGELEPPGKGVKAHEKTMAGPKADRLNATRHTRAQLGNIFMLYVDERREIDRILNNEIESKDPDYTAVDYHGNYHNLWIVTNIDTISKVQAIMNSKELFIADGHHRYETAVNYWQECVNKGLVPESGAMETFRNRMITLVSMENPGLVIFPTHRVVHSIENFNLNSFLQKASKCFEIAEFEWSSEVEKEEIFKSTMLKMKEMSQQGKHAFVFMPKKGNSIYILSLIDESIMDNAITEDISAQWKRLDASILHKLLLEDILGIDAKALEEKRNLYYIRYKEEGFNYLKNDESVIGIFFMNPTKIEEVKKIADIGERMPQKSTDFYPKLLSGFVFNKLRFSGEQ